MTATRVSLVVLGTSTRVLSTLCGECPHHAAGCCHAPPPYDLADLARVVRAEGGMAFLRQALEDGAVVVEGIARPRALHLATHKRRIVQGSQVKGRARACSQLADEGCSLHPSFRPATCNYFVCGAGLHDETAPEDPRIPFELLREWWTRVNRAFDEEFPELPERWWTDEDQLRALGDFLAAYELRAGLAAELPSTDDQNSV